MRKVVIIIFAYKEHPNKFEEISLKQCYKVLGKYPIRLVCPNGLDISYYQSIIPQIKVDFIKPIWLSSIDNYNTLLLSPFLYYKYLDFEFILIYQLDAFVFRDELTLWCEKKFDYIGAPWFFHNSNKYNAVGNGGFSLRKTKSHFKIALNYNKQQQKKIIFQKLKSLKLKKKILQFPHFFFAILGLKDFKSQLICYNYYSHEDYFWGCNVKKYFKWFKVADFRNATKFSFEKNPRNLFRWNNNNLPFGCHRWERYDFDFWRPFIKKEGYDLEEL